MQGHSVELAKKDEEKEEIKQQLYQLQEKYEACTKPEVVERYNFYETDKYRIVVRILTLNSSSEEMIAYIYNRQKGLITNYINYYEYC